MNQTLLENISVKRIKLLTLFINEHLYVHDPTKIIRIDVGFELGHVIENNLVQLLTTINYHFAETDPTNPVAKVQVQNIFEIQELKKYEINPSQIILPPDIITILVELSISHSRALLANALSGTPYQDNILGLIDPDGAARYFFPYMFPNVAIPK